MLRQYATLPFSCTRGPYFLMKKRLLHLLSFTLLVHARAQLPANPTPPQPISRWETRTFHPSDFHNIQLDFSDGTLTLVSGNVTYTSSPDNIDSSGEKIAAAETLLTEIRHAARIQIGVGLPASNHIYTHIITLEFDSIK